MRARNYTPTSWYSSCTIMRSGARARSGPRGDARRLDRSPVKCTEVSPSTRSQDPRVGCTPRAQRIRLSRAYDRVCRARKTASAGAVEGDGLSSRAALFPTRGHSLVRPQSAAHSSLHASAPLHAHSAPSTAPHSHCSAALTHDCCSALQRCSQAHPLLAARSCAPPFEPILQPIHTFESGLPQKRSRDAATVWHGHRADAD